MLLGIVLGTMVEQSFITSLIKSDGSILPFFSRPVAAILAFFTIAALLWPVALLALGDDAAGKGGSSALLKPGRLASYSATPHSCARLERTPERQVR
jgi:hypothetical protein